MLSLYTSSSVMAETMRARRF